MKPTALQGLVKQEQNWDKYALCATRETTSYASEAHTQTYVLACNVWLKGLKELMHYLSHQCGEKGSTIEGVNVLEDQHTCLHQLNTTHGLNKWQIRHKSWKTADPQKVFTDKHKEVKN